MIVSTKDGGIAIRAKAELLRRRRAEVSAEPDEPLDLNGFLRAAWHVLEPDTKFIDGWHIGAIAEHLQAVTEGEINRLIINVPPGSMKSLTTCVMWPAWEWGEVRPSTRWLFGSYSYPLAVRDSLKMRRLIRSGWYQGRYGHRFHILHGHDKQNRYDNNHGGFRLSTSVGGVGTGERVHRAVIDDPQKKTDIHTVRRTRANNWIKTELRTRGTSPEEFSIVLIQQRLHEYDATGFLLEEMGGFEHLYIPARYEPERKCVVGATGWEDPREEDGEIYWQMYDDDSLSELESDLGAAERAGQLQQSPSPATGHMFKEHYWSYWYPEGEPPPPPVEVRIEYEDEDGMPATRIIEKIARPLDLRIVTTMIQSWDLTFKDTEASKYVAGQVWGVAIGQPANAYLLDQMRSKADIVRSIRMIYQLTEKWPGAGKKLIEDKANGPAVLRMLRDKISGLKPVQADKSKVSRARAVMPRCEAGNVFLPHPHYATWVTDYVEEHKVFPSGRYNDQVDATTQALIELGRDSASAEPIEEDSLLSGLVGSSYFAGG